MSNEAPPCLALPLGKESQSAPISCLAFSPTADVLVVAREAREVELWDTCEGIRLQILYPDVIDLESVIFSDDAQRLYVKNVVYGLG